MDIETTKSVDNHGRPFYAIFNMNDFSRASGKYRDKSNAQADCERMNLRGRIYHVIEVDATGHPF